MATAAWETGAFGAPAGLAAVAGGLLMLVAAALLAGSVAWPVREPSESIRLVVRLRRIIWGAVLAMAGAGIAFDAPFLVVAAVVIALEETLEVGIVLWALRRDPG